MACSVANRHSIAGTDSLWAIINHIMSVLEPLPAATVVIVQHSPQRGAFEVLLLKRNADLVFMGDHWVFPGGRVDQGDYQSGSAVGSAATVSQRAAALQAAIRETREEAGVTLDPATLVPIAHWTTPAGAVRRYATWFFLSVLRQAQVIAIDNQEILDYCWLAPAEAIARARSGALRLSVPTLRTLERLAGHTDAEDLLRSVTGSNIEVYPENSVHFSE